MKRINKFLKTILSLIFVFSFVLLAQVWCWKDGHNSITDIYLPAGQWNDEVFYYKQIASMIKYGIPRGYFGYNEMTAPYLTFGAWSFVLLIPYYLLGLILGWNLHMPIVCNLIMITLALALFFYWVHPNVKQMIMWLVLIAAMPMITRYIISGMVESVFFSATILLVGMQKRLQDQYSRLLLILLYLVIGFLTLARPYMIIFLVIPFYILYRRNKRLAIFFTIGYAAVNMLSYGFISTYFCAPYTSSIINIDFIDVFFKDGLLSMMQYLVLRLSDGVMQLGMYMHSALNYGGIGEVYILFSILFIFMIISCIHKRGKVHILLFSVLALGGIVLAIVLFYSVNAGSRHLLMFLIYGIMVLILEEHIKVLIPLSIVLWGVCTLVPKDACIYEIPYNTDKILVEKNNKMELELEKKLKLDNEERWNNTIDWIYDEDYGICYFIPDGFGINICFENQMVDENQAKYILVKNGTETQKKCKNKYIEQWEGDNYTLYYR